MRIPPKCRSASSTRAAQAAAWLICFIALSIIGALPPNAASQASAQPEPPVHYDATARTIYVGANYSRGTPAEAPYVGFPSHPDAPKQAISVPALARALADIGQPDLLIDQGGGAWLLRGDLVIRPTARLEATSATIAALRLDSTPTRVPGLTRLVADGGHLLIQGISVVSWDAMAGAVDSEYQDGRSYLLALNGARMDIIDAEVAYLGWADGEPSGLAWRKRATPSDPQTGATGSILRSTIHHNYFGQYSYEAYGLRVLNSEFHHNAFYGFDPHDYSTRFEIAYNKVYNNGKHGIIFSRGCESNWIHHNEVYGNGEHGIMLDRGSDNNRITDNLVYDNRDAIAIFQSSDNLIQSNILRDNERGVRINATYDANDLYDGLASGNRVEGNTITQSAQYGIYLYERGDGNIIAGNKLEGSGASAVYVRSGGNTIERNVIRDNGHGVTIVGSAYTTPPPGGPRYVAPESQPGLENRLFGNTIEDNAGTGVQVQAGTDTLIGPRSLAQSPEQGNQIRTNGSSGIILSQGSVGSIVQGNTIHANGRDGVEVRGATSLRNVISRNSITANARFGINIRDSAQGGLGPPTITSADDAAIVTGMSTPGATVEIYRDTNGQGNVYKGSAVAATDGSWSFPLPAGDDPRQGPVAALTTSGGNSSIFATNAPVTVQATYTVGAGRNGELTVFVSGPGASVTLPDLQAALQVISPTVTLLENQGGGVWQANANIFLSRGVTLTVAAPTVTWLKLRSQAGDITLAAEHGPYNYHSFTTLRTHSGAILLDSVRVTSWDPGTNAYDLDISDGRSYLLAKYDARLDIRNAELSYLGSADGESYGISWRDTNDSETPDVLQTRVTGEVLNSTFSYNYYGIYTYQASNMVFRGNKFHHNIGYGFDPHDYSNNFVVEDNEAFENGNHGFIISRGCNNFVLRRNKSYRNRYAMDELDRNAHGFMIDPGSPNSRYPQVPSFDNLLEDNEAWDNQGYGLRILGSNNNTIRGNQLRNNLQGISLERDSVGNVIEGNLIVGNTEDGIDLRGAANTTITDNEITRNGAHGIYLSAQEGIGATGNRLSGNTVIGNRGYGIRANGAETRDNSWSQNSVSVNQAGGIRNFSGANNALAPPRLTAQSPTGVEGTAAPGASVEIFSDDDGQGRFYEGQTTAGADGRFSLSVSPGWRGLTLNATATDASGNSSGFAVDRPLVRIYLPLVRR